MNKETLDRLHTESEELFDKLTKLEAFVTTHPKFYRLDKTQQGLLRTQLHAMLTYHNILNLRIETLTQ